MKHYTSEEWVDFVRNVLEPNVAAAMKAHLDDCGKCQAAYRLWNDVSASASKDSLYAPPNSAVRMAKSLFTPAEPAGDVLDSVLKLVFDSAREPLPMGVRGSASVCRQLLYQYGQRFIDLRVEQQPAHREVSLIGQIQESTVRNTAISVDLYCGERLIQHAETNTQGEFHMVFPPTDGLHLEIAVNEKKFRVRVPEVTESKD